MIRSHRLQVQVHPVAVYIGVSLSCLFICSTSMLILCLSNIGDFKDMHANMNILSKLIDTNNATCDR